MKRQTRGALRVPLLILALVFTACTFGGVLSGGFNTLFGSIAEQTAAAAAAWNRPSDDALLSENRRLTEENSRLKAALAGYAEAKDENEKLWRFYDMKRIRPLFLSSLPRCCGAARTTTAARSRSASEKRTAYRSTIPSSPKTD